jgi:Flp pilus assembly protein TadD
MQINGARVLRLTTGAATMALALTGCGSRESIATASAAQADPGTPAALLLQRSEDARAQGNAAAAISFAELAVTANPQDFDARAALAKAYLGAGRFHSAAEAYGDMAAMRPDDDGARFRAALAELGKGNRRTALAALDGLAGANGLGADVGLALALAGDTDRAVALLEAAVRAGDATARTRQNLALAQALAGKWAAARVTASVDLAPDAIVDRVAQWAALASNSDVAWRTATVLGVTPAETDAGRPVELAWAPPATAAPTATADAAIEPAVAPSQPAELAALVNVPPSETPAPVAAAPVVRSEPVAIAKVDVPSADAPKPVVFDGLRRTSAEMPQSRKAIATAESPRAVAAVKREIRALPKPTVGTWVVQVGAYAKPQFMTVGWQGLVRENKALGEFKPMKSSIDINGATYHRLAVGTFATVTEAGAFCQALKDAGQKCFVRKGEGGAARGPAKSA